eukprot:10638747-Ditylum_brightwellii.AAC.1
MATKTDLLLDLMIKIGKEDLPTAINRKYPTDSIAQLGLLNNPAVDFEDEAIKKEKRSIQIVNRMKHKSLSSKNAYRLYQNVWLLSMQYSMAITLFSKAMCLCLMKPFVRAILPKLGFNCNTTKEIIYGSLQSGGF